MARIKDFWICCKRRRSIPWAIHVFAEKEGRNVMCDYVVYAEWIDNKRNCVSVENVPLQGDYSVFLAEFEKICTRYQQEIYISNIDYIKAELNDFIEREF